jgi:hypothetical protein
MAFRRTLTVRAPALSLLLAVPAGAATIVLDFEEQPNPYPALTFVSTRQLGATARSFSATKATTRFFLERKLR